MADAKPTTPALRFNGFVEDWKERPLKEVAVKVVEKNINLQFTETFTNSAEFGVISQRDYFDHDISNSDNIGTYYVVQNEDFVYNPRISTFAPVGPINRNKLGRSGVMSPLYTVLRTHDIDNTYLEQYFKGGMWHSFMKLNGDSGARSDRFSIKDSMFVEMPIPYPELNEQASVGKYFDNLDSLIALQRRKLVKLQNVKKAMLQKMFPTRGGTTPQIRFAGFTEPWQEQKLGDLAEIVRGASPRPIKDPRWFNSDSEIGWLRISDVTEQDGRIQYLEQRLSAEGQEHTRVLTEPHLLLSIAATVGKPLVNYVPTGVHDGFLIFLNPQFDREFMFQWLEMFRPQWSQYGQPGSQVNLNSDLVKNKTLLLPDEKEQIKIGIYFKHLDARISLQQRKLEKLQNVKKACLAAMFV